MQTSERRRFLGGTLRSAVTVVAAAGVLRPAQALAEWPAGEPEPTKYWFCDLPATTPLRRLVRAAKCRWAIEQDYQQLKHALGLDHYEGRGWIGWHHHLTLVMLAPAFLTLETLRRKHNFWVGVAADAP